MRLTLQQLEAHLWGAANILRGKTAGQDYKNYILSLMFYKRLCDQWECEADEAIAELERQQGRAFSDKEKAVFRKRGEHRFQIPDGSRWGDVKAASTNLGEVLTKAMRAVANANDELRGVFTVDWNQPAPDGSGKPLIPNEVVHALVQHFDEHDLSNRSVPSDVNWGNAAKVKRRKADDEHLIRKALLESQLIDAVISLPLNVFYGAGVPACLLILRKQRPAERRDRVLLVYAARHYRELSAQNELRPQDVMRMLVHVQAYGDAAKVGGLVDERASRIRGQIDSREEEEVGRIEAEYQPQADKLAALDAELVEARRKKSAAGTKQEKAKVAGAIAKLEKQRERLGAKIAERDERIAEARRRAEDDRRDVSPVGDELIALYADPDELLKHARVVGLDEIEENEFNLNIPRYVDTFEPEPRVEVKDALKALREAEAATQAAEADLSRLLKQVGIDV